jgi:hypothetical protein
MTFKTATVLTVAASVLLLGACRKEVPHSPMKLGADVPAVGQVSVKSLGSN